MRLVRPTAPSATVLRSLCFVQPKVSATRLVGTITQSISKWGKVDRGAAMGITFTTMFALGLLLIVQATDHVDIDPGCVLYGALELTPFNTFGVIEMAGYIIDIPHSAIVLSIVLCMNLGIIILLFNTNCE